MRFKNSLFLLLLLSLGFVLGACGGGEESSGTDEATDETSEATEDSGGEKTLVFARGGDSESLDPGSTSDGESSRVTQQVLETLLTFEKESFELQPGLAHDWEVSD